MRSFSALYVLAALCGCTPADPDLPALEFESRRARLGVGRALSHPLCAGDLASVDRRIEWVEGRLGVRREAPITAYLLEEDSVPCLEEQAACYFKDDDVIYGTWRSLGHEIVHAIARDIAFPSLFWSEGTAALLTGNRTFKDDTLQLDPATLDSDPLYNYVSATHFARFLVETRGWDSYNLAIRGTPLAEAYGETAEELTLAYEQDAPFSYPGMDPCAHPQLAAVDEGAWFERFQFSCDSIEATQFEDYEYSQASDAAVLRTINLESGTYVFELAGGATFEALRCQTDILSRPESTPFEDDIRIEGYGLPNVFRANEQHILKVSSGTYWLSISSGTTDFASAELSVTRMK